MPPAHAAFLCSSNNDRDFIVKARRNANNSHTSHTHAQALGQDVRLDGRAPMAKRPLHVQVCHRRGHSGAPRCPQVATDDQSAAVRLGATYVQCSIHAELTAPRKQRGNEGTVHFAVDLGPSAAYDTRQVRCTM